MRSYGYAPPSRAAPTRDIPAQGRRAQFTIPLSGETTVGHQTTGDPVSQGEPGYNGNGGSVGPGGHGPIAYIDTPPKSSPPSATKQPPFDIVSRGKAEPLERVVDAPRIDPINLSERPKTGAQNPAYNLSPIVRQPTAGIVPLGSGTKLPLPVKGLTPTIGYRPKPVEPGDYSGAAPGGFRERSPTTSPQVPGQNFTKFKSYAGQRLSIPGTYDPAGQRLMGRQRKPDPDETKAGNQ